MSASLASSPNIPALPNWWQVCIRDLIRGLQRPALSEHSSTARTYPLSIHLAKFTIAIFYTTKIYIILFYGTW